MDTNITYRLYDDGYDIYINGMIALSQREPYAKIFVPDGTYEENAQAHVAELQKPPVPTEEEKVRSDIDFLAMELGVDLPSDEN